LLLGLAQFRLEKASLTPYNLCEDGENFWGAQGGEAPWRGTVPFRPNPLTPFPARGGGKFGGGPGERLTPQKTLANPKPTGGGQMGGPGGRSPHGRGFGGCAPRTLRRGRVAHISNSATSGTQNAGEPKAHGGGQMGGPGGRSPHGRGFGGCAPKIKKKGRVARISNPATSGAQNSGEP